MGEAHLRREAQKITPNVVVEVPPRFGCPAVVPVEHRQERSHDTSRDGHVRHVQEEKARADLDLHDVFLYTFDIDRPCCDGTKRRRVLLDGLGMVYNSKSEYVNR